MKTKINSDLEEKILRLNGAAGKLRAIALLLSGFDQHTVTTSGFNPWIYLGELLEDIATDIDHSKT